MESLPIKYFDTHAHGDIMSVYTNDVDTLRQLLSQSIPQIINSVITMAATLVTMLVLNPAADRDFHCHRRRDAAGHLQFLQAVRHAITSSSSAIWAAVDGFIEEMMDGQKVVKVFCHEEAAMADFHKVNRGPA